MDPLRPHLPQRPHRHPSVEGSNPANGDWATTDGYGWRILRAMAKETIERLIDDIDGSEADVNVRFEIDGQSWSIDLNSKHENEMRAKLGPFLDAARRVRNEPASGRAALRIVADKTRNPAIRQWALEEGVELPSRGRIAGAVQDAYDAKDVAALYAAVGLEMEQTPKRGRRRISAEFSAAE